MIDYPVYIPTKGRYENCLTAKVLTRDNVPFTLVVEPQEERAYHEAYPEAELLVLPFRDKGSVIPARNYIKDYSTARGDKRHWQLDDNIRDFRYFYRGNRVYCNAGIALHACEHFTDRYTNVAISGLNYQFFAVKRGGGMPPFNTNIRVYSCNLILNDTPYRFRGRYNEDTDYCLQVLSDGQCTLLLNAFLIDKMTTMTMSGGNKSELYDHDDGRLKMARALERRWPGVVTTRRRFGRPQHTVHDAWKKFDTPLKLRDDFDPERDAFDIPMQIVGDPDHPDLKRLVTTKRG